jgi:hypothetical protein
MKAKIQVPLGLTQKLKASKDRKIILTLPIADDLKIMLTLYNLQNGGENMSTFAVVPVKALFKSKTRLSTLFTSQERRFLTLAMLSALIKWHERPPRLTLPIPSR